MSVVPWLILLLCMLLGAYFVFIPLLGKQNKTEHSTNTAAASTSSVTTAYSTNAATSPTSSVTTALQCNQMNCSCTKYTEDQSKWGKGKCKTCFHPKSQHKQKSTTFEPNIDDNSSQVNIWKNQFQQAFFSKNQLDYGDDEKKSIQEDVTGQWDKNLEKGLCAMMSSEQEETFTSIVQTFDEKVNELSNEHKKIHLKIKSNADKKVIQNDLDSLMVYRRNKILREEKEQLTKIQEKHTEKNERWDQIQQQTLAKNNNDVKLKRKIESERRKRVKFQEKQIDNIKRKCTRKIENINTLHDEQQVKLQSTDNMSEWHKKFEKEETHKAKINTLQEMVVNKILATRTQISFAKYLHNSPFARNLKEEARKLDHEITKIAKLAGEPLLIDLVNRDIDDRDNDDDDKKDEFAEENEQFLEFELRFDEEYDSWNSDKEWKMTQDLAALIGVNVNKLQFISTRAGTIVSRFKTKMNAVYDAAKKKKQNMKKSREKIKTELSKAIQKEVKTLSGKVFSGSWANKIDESVQFLEKQIGHVKTSKDALYLSSKCVAMVITHSTRKRSGSVIDGDFLKDDVQKEQYKVLMDPKWDKKYGKDKVHWEGANKDEVDRGGQPYFCPNGWKRYGIRVDNFDTKYKGWSVCYHGSQSFYMGSILTHGILGTQDQTQRYFSPSIEYAAHPRYATPKKMKNGKYVQTVFQCRINSDPMIMNKVSETMAIGRTKVIDSNFSNDFQKCQCSDQKRVTEYGGYHCNVDGHNEMEWYLEGTNIDQYIVYGIMMRISDDPAKLNSSHWWSKSAKKGGMGNKSGNWRKD